MFHDFNADGWGMGWGWIIGGKNAMPKARFNKDEFDVRKINLC